MSDALVLADDEAASRHLGRLGNVASLEFQSTRTNR